MSYSFQHLQPIIRYATKAPLILAPTPPLTPISPGPCSTSYGTTDIEAFRHDIEHELEHETKHRQKHELKHESRAPLQPRGRDILIVFAAIITVRKERG